MFILFIYYVFATLWTKVEKSKGSLGEGAGCLNYIHTISLKCSSYSVSAWGFEMQKARLEFPSDWWTFQTWLPTTLYHPYPYSKPEFTRTYCNSSGGKPAEVCRKEGSEGRERGKGKEDISWRKRKGRKSEMKWEMGNGGKGKGRWKGLR